jgi:hypothetical protein
MVYFNDINDLKRMEKALIGMKNSLISLKQANEEQTQNELKNSENNVIMN